MNTLFLMESSSMSEKNISETIEKYKKIYQKFQPTFSPAINGKVYYSMAGFKHLIFKNKHRRKNSVIHARMTLIPLIRPVIRRCNEITETRARIEIVKGKSVRVTYKALEARVGKNSTRVKVIIKKTGNNGKYYFQSIMRYN